jgi:hypothetical protein
LHRKSDALEVFKEYHKAAVNEFEGRFDLQAIRTDAGGEFTSNAFKKYPKETGIAAELTAPSPLKRMVYLRLVTISSLGEATPFCTMPMPQRYIGQRQSIQVFSVQTYPSPKGMVKLQPLMCFGMGKSLRLAICGCGLAPSLPKKCNQRTRSRMSVPLGARLWATPTPPTFGSFMIPKNSVCLLPGMSYSM